MPHVPNIRNSPGFKDRQLIIPPGAVYVGHAVRWHRLPKSKSANPFTVKLETDRQTAADERWLELQPLLMEALHVLVGRDLVCWCAPLPYHSDVLLRLANE